MKKTILIIISFAFLVGLISATGINTYYTLNVNYNKGNFTFLSSDIEQSKGVINYYFGNYTVALLDYEGNILDIYFFDVPKNVLYDKIDENGTIYGGGEIEVDDVNFTLFIPYYENASKLYIYDENASKKIEIDVGFYSKDYKEFNPKAKEGLNENKSINQDNISSNLSEKDNNLVTEEEGTFLEKASHYWWILLIILIILLGILINYIRK